MVDKIRELLESGGPTSEAEVVYLMAQVRKTMELEGRYSNALSLYCNWTLHTELSKARTVAPLLKVMDRYVDLLLTAADPFAQSACVEILASFGTFRSDLRDFLLEHDMSAAICEQESAWLALMRLYVEVVADAPLTIAATSGECRHVAKVVLSGVVHFPVPSPPQVRWDIYLHDGRKTDLHVGMASGDFGKGYSFGWIGGGQPE